jgi:hypothetical protein
MRASKLKCLVRQDGFSDLLELFRIDCIASHNKLETYQWLKDYADNLQAEEIRIAIEDVQLEGQTWLRVLLAPLSPDRNRHGILERGKGRGNGAGFDRFGDDAVFEFAAVGAAQLGSDYGVYTGAGIPVAEADGGIGVSRVNYSVQQHIAVPLGEYP